MGLFSRSSSSAPTAVHARIADGEHLWLAVRDAGEGPLSLRPVDGGADVPVPAEVEGELLVAVFPLAAALAEQAGRAGAVELRLCHGRKATAVRPGWDARPSTPTVDTPPTRDRRWQLAVEAIGEEVVVRRTPIAATVALLGLRRVDDTVELRLDAPTGTLACGGVTVDLVDGVARLDALLAGATNSTEPVPLTLDDTPVVRAANVLDRPHLAVLLPPTGDPAVDLRWLRDGRLALERKAPA